MKPMMMTENVSAQLETSANAANAANAAKKTYPRGRWSMTSNPWKQATSNLPVKESVQGELAMESVHPIRNSLDDSDLEFKLTSDKSNQSSKSKASGNPSGNPFRGRPQEGFWTRLKSKLKGSAKS